MKLKHILAKEKSELTNGIIDWSFTFTIIHFKKVNHKGVYKEFKKFKLSEQKEILNKIKLICEDLLINCELHFETHPEMNKNVYHAHGTIFKVSNEKIKHIQQLICEYVSIKENSFWEYFYYVPTFHMAGWSTYCLKEVEKEHRLKLLAQSIQEEEEKDSPRYKVYRFPNTINI